jgi:hypothetical protein
MYSSNQMNFDESYVVSSIFCGIFVGEKTTEVVREQNSKENVYNYGMEVRRGRRKLHNEVLHNCYSPQILLLSSDQGGFVVQDMYQEDNFT